MARSLNKVMLIGNAGKDPELKVTPSGTGICSFSLATSESKKNASGEWEQKSEWHNIKVMGKQAVWCGKNIVKGSLVYVEGKIETESWEDKQSGEKKYKTWIIAFEAQLLSGGAEKTDQAQTQQTSLPVADDDLPF